MLNALCMNCELSPVIDYNEYHFHKTDILYFRYFTF